jgi:hypothetical protein
VTSDPLNLTPWGLDAVARLFHACPWVDDRTGARQKPAGNMWVPLDQSIARALSDPQRRPGGAVKWTKRGPIIRRSVLQAVLTASQARATDWPSTLAALRARVAAQERDQDTQRWWTAADVDALEKRIVPLWRRPS